MSTFTLNLQAVLQSRSMSIQSLADASGLRRSYLSRLVHGHHSPSLEIAEKIANGCGIPLYELLRPNSQKIPA